MAAPIQGIRYPIDLQVDKDTDYFQIQVLSYARKSLTQADTATIEGIQSILLPMPSNIQDANTVSWGEEKMNNIVAGALLGTYNMMSNVNPAEVLKGNFDQVTDAFNAGLEGTGLKGTDISKLITQQLAAEAVNIFGANVSIDQILARQDGKIFNPNLELLFNGVTLRDFRFSFKMTPRDTKERDNVIKIIRTFKKYMAASNGSKEKNSTNLYLKTPNVFKLAYKKGGADHPFLHRFKDCALKGVSVNYTGENVYATYWDGTPISVVLDLNFQELTPIYNEDYPSESADTKLGVGY